MKKIIILISVFLISTFSFSFLPNQDLYNKLNEPALDENVFDRAINGLEKIDAKNKDILTIIDYTKSSNEKRIFVIDLVDEKIILDTYVSHGKNTGQEFAKDFSNTLDSLQSSVGFFETAESYNGANGYSLRMDGLEEGINDNARKRNIVIHGAKYVNESFIQQNGRLGRSWGCPAVPVEFNTNLINTIKDGSIVYINGDLNNYLKNTKI